MLTNEQVTVSRETKIELKFCSVKLGHRKKEQDT